MKAQCASITGFKVKSLVFYAIIECDDSSVFLLNASQKLASPIRYY